MILIKTISSRYDKLKRLLVKFSAFGLNDIQEAISTASFGVDSNPIPEMVAVYAETASKGAPMIIGYINKDRLAAIGETRLFSTDDQGVLQNYVWLKNDGNIEIGGDDDNMVRYSKLEEAFNELKTDHNNLVTEWNNFATAYLPGGPVNVGLPATLAGTQEPPSAADILPSKIDNIKTTT